MRVQTLETLVAGLKESGVKAVVLADPRFPLSARAEDLPVAVLSVVAVGREGGLPGNPLDFRTVPSAEPEWEHDVEARWWWQEELRFQVDVLAHDLESAVNVTQAMRTWLFGPARESLRMVKAHVREVTPARRTTELLAGLETGAVERWTFEFTVVEAHEEGSRYPAVESVVLRGRYPGAVHEERQLVVGR